MKTTASLFDAGALYRVLSGAALSVCLTSAFIRPTAAADILGNAASCDPSLASCSVPGGAGSPECPQWKQQLGLCAGPGGGGGGDGGGGSCTPAPGGSPGCSGAGPASMGGGSVSVGGGNPINLISGNKYQEEVDLPPLPGVLGLELKRYYNSQSTHPGLLGANWRMSYETVLYDFGSQIRIVQADGRRLVFQRGVGGNAALCSSAQPQDGQVRIEEPRDGKGRHVYHWRWPDGSTLMFTGGSGSGFPLNAITAPGGHRLTLSYAPTGELTSIRDPQGRTLSFIYAGRDEWRSRALEAIDTPLGRISYSQDAMGRLTEVASSKDAASPPYVSRLYHYEDKYNAGRKHALTGISLRGTDPHTQQTTLHRLSTYAYNAAGQAVVSTRGRPREVKEGVQLSDTGIEQIEIEYVEKASPIEGRPDRTTGEVMPRQLGKSVLTNSLGHKTEILSAVIGGRFQLVEMKGPGCSTCGPSNMSYGYDASGQLLRSTRLDDRGRPIESELRRYDGFGRLARTGRQVHAASGKPEPVQWLRRYEYTDTRFKDGSVAVAPYPDLIARPSVVTDREHVLRIAYNDIWRPTSVSEEGYSPVDGQGRADARGVPIGRTTTYRHERIGGRSVLVEIDGPLNNGPEKSPEDSDIARAEWDASGSRVIGWTEPGGFESAISYDAVTGRIARVENAEGFATAFSYDERGQPSSISSVGTGAARPQVQSFKHDERGHRVETGAGSESDGSYRALSRRAFDAAGRLVWSASHLGMLEQSRYDTESRLVEAGRHSDSMALVQRYAYDLYGRLARTSDSSGAALSLEYDALGLPRSLTDALGRTRRLGRDAALPPASNDAQTPPGVRQIRDDFGRIVATISPDSGTTVRRFDEADRLIASTDALGNHATYEYDAAGRIARQRIADSATGDTTSTVWRYAGKRLVALEHPSQSERYEHDERGRLRSKVVALEQADGSSLNSVTRYSYDESDALLSTSLPDGSTLLYERNGQGQVVALRRHRIKTAWLRWLLPAETVVEDIERDLVGLKRYRTGNGVQAHFLRSREGVLARVLYRAARQRSRATVTARNRASMLDLFGVASVRAAEPRGTATDAAIDNALSALPGALNLPADPNAIIDHRYLWDVQGNLLLADSRAERKSSRTGYAYDDRDRLIVAAQAKGDASEASRYFYDAAGRRVLSQQRFAEQADVATRTRGSRYQVTTHRWLGEEDGFSAQYDDGGRPRRIGQRNYAWDALGRLIEVRQDGRVVANYRYSHRGERIGKSVGNRTTAYLHDSGRLTAEINGQGRLTRQYVYLADQPIAVIDSPKGKEFGRDDAAALTRVVNDLGMTVRAWLGDDDGLVWLHANHLGAAEAATMKDGKVVWQASYQPFGQATVRASDFELNLRLPGQYEDPETGLHYNRHRYYDPQRGEYLTPDPLGAPDGPNPYVYVRANPLKYVDSTGLVLFAFDGTGNSENPGAGDSISNVMKFYQAYDQTANGKAFYITGIGTTNIDMPYKGNMANGDGFDQRVALGFQFLEGYIDASQNDTAAMPIDVVGFSRGAAEARVWMNELVSRLSQGEYTTAAGHKRCLELRFEGLWDTVPHLGYLNGNESKYDFSIPNQVKYAAHAVALNEHRGGIANFHGRSIWDTAASSSGANRVEKGFIGSHADIGGGYGTGDLSDVALMWMIEQAKGQQIDFLEKAIKDNEWDQVTSPIVHDKSSNKIDPGNAPQYGDRNFVYGSGAKVQQTTAVIDGKDTAWTNSMVSYYSTWCGPSGAPAVGQVDMEKYAQWLASQGVILGYKPPGAVKACS